MASERYVRAVQERRAGMEHMAQGYMQSLHISNFASKLNMSQEDLAQDVNDRLRWCFSSA